MTQIGFRQELAGRMDLKVGYKTVTYMTLNRHDNELAKRVKIQIISGYA